MECKLKIQGYLEFDAGIKKFIGRLARIKNVPIDELGYFSPGVSRLKANDFCAEVARRNLPGFISRLA